MKIGVIGDTHLGRTLYGYDLTPSIRRTLYAFFRLCRDRGVDRAVHLGDLFDGPRPSLALEKIAIQWCNEFERAQIPLHLLAGNHDVVSRGGITSALATIRAVNYQFVRVHESPERLSTGFPGWDVVMVPFSSPGLVRTASDALMALSRTLRGMRKGSRSIVFSHWNVEGARMGEQEWVYRGGDYTLPDTLHRDPRVALIISGHIHKSQTIGDNHLVLGAAQLLRFGEDSNPSFAVLTEPEGVDGVDLYETGEANRLVSWEADVSAWGNGGDPPAQRDLLEHAAGLVVEGAIVRVQPFVDEFTVIDWAGVEAALYSAGAEHVKVISPISVKRNKEAAPRRIRKGVDPVKVAAFFVRKRVRKKGEREAVMEVFRSVQQDAQE